MLPKKNIHGRNLSSFPIFFIALLLHHALRPLLPSLLLLPLLLIFRTPRRTTSGSTHKIIACVAVGLAVLVLGAARGGNGGFEVCVDVIGGGGRGRGLTWIKGCGLGTGGGCI